MCKVCFDNFGIDLFIAKPDNALIKDIAYKGSYAFKGDEVEITGIFNRSCTEHGGDLDIHAQSIRKITPGRQISETLDFKKTKSALMLSGILILLFIWDMAARKRYSNRAK